MNYFDREENYLELIKLEDDHKSEVELSEAEILTHFPSCLVRLRKNIKKTKQELSKTGERGRKIYRLKKGVHESRDDQMGAILDCLYREIVKKGINQKIDELIDRLEAVENEYRKIKAYKKRIGIKRKVEPNEYDNWDDLKENALNIDIELILSRHGVEKCRNGFYKCPLHSEKTGSFKVYKGDDRDSFYCFGCGEAGDVISLYEKLNNCDFKTALKELKEI